MNKYQINKKDKYQMDHVRDWLTKKASLKVPLNLDPVYYGRNNRVFKVRQNNGSLLLKLYFQSKGDLRDRLNSEFLFSSFAWRNGLKVIPRPVTFDKSLSIGLYEFVKGEKLSPGQVRLDHVKQAIEFFHALNGLKNNPEANKLPEASEAFFNLKQHINCVDTRLNLLGKIKEQNNITKQAVQFINTELLPVWKTEKELLFKKAGESGINLDQNILPKDRCISPSDFGFHNAIREENGRIRFIDFEYAGWDDPAKTVCDFFCQPEVPVPMKHFSFFFKNVLKMSETPETLAQRVQLLFPLYKIKWCCIILNDFLPSENKRRNFANPEDKMKRRKVQLEKTRRYLNNFIKRSY